MSTSIKCECGEVTGDMCEWSGPITQTRVIYWIPPWMRDTLRAAGSAWPRSIGTRLRVERSCADMLLRDESEQPWIVEP